VILRSIQAIHRYIDAESTTHRKETRKERDALGAADDYRSLRLRRRERRGFLRDSNHFVYRKCLDLTFQSTCSLIELSAAEPEMLGIGLHLSIFSAYSAAHMAIRTLGTCNLGFQVLLYRVSRQLSRGMLFSEIRSVLHRGHADYTSHCMCICIRELSYFR